MARNRLIDKDLIAFDGRLFQVLSLPPKPARGAKRLLRSPEDMAGRDPATRPSDHPKRPEVKSSCPMNEASHAVLDVHTMEAVELEISQINLRYAHTRIMTRESLIRLAASIEQWGQIMPVITVSPCVLIDGYRRLAALKLCKRDTVMVEHWNCREDQALLRVLSVGCERRWDVVAQAALLRELTCCHRSSMTGTLSSQSWGSRGSYQDPGL